MKKVDMFQCYFNYGNPGNLMTMNWYAIPGSLKPTSHPVSTKQCFYTSTHTSISFNWYMFCCLNLLYLCQECTPMALWSSSKIRGKKNGIFLLFASHCWTSSRISLRHDIYYYCGLLINTFARWSCVYPALHGNK